MATDALVHAGLANGDESAEQEVRDLERAAEVAASIARAQEAVVAAGSTMAAVGEHAAREPPERDTTPPKRARAVEGAGNLGAPGSEQLQAVGGSSALGSGARPALVNPEPDREVSPRALLTAANRLRASLAEGGRVAARRPSAPLVSPSDGGAGWLGVPLIHPAVSALRIAQAAGERAVEGEVAVG